MALVLFAISQAWNRSEKTFGYDYYQFWVTGQELGKPGADNVYSDTWRQSTGERYWQMAQAIKDSTPQHVAADSRHVLETYSTPLLYTFFRFIGTANYARSLLIYQLIHFASGMAAIAIFRRMLRYSLTATLLMIAVMFGWGEAYLSEILCSNVNQVELLAIAVLAWFELRPDGARRDYLCGGGMALIVLFKPNLVAVAGLLALMWVVDRRFAALRRHAIGFALATIVIVTLTSIQFGSLRCWGQWLAAAGDLPQLVAKEGKQVYSLQSVTMTRLGRSWGVAVQYAAPILTILAIALPRLRADVAPPDESQRGFRTLLIMALGCALPLISSPVCWLHYHILGVPLLMISMRPSGWRRRASVAIGAKHHWLLRGVIALSIAACDQLGLAGR